MAKAFAICEIDRRDLWKLLEYGNEEPIESARVARVVKDPRPPPRPCSEEISPHGPEGSPELGLGPLHGHSEEDMGEVSRGSSSSPIGGTQDSPRGQQNQNHHVPQKAAPNGRRSTEERSNESERRQHN